MLALAFVIFNPPVLTVTNAPSIRMHTALGFQPSGHIDNLPQGTRELLFYKRIPPRTLGSTS